MDEFDQILKKATIAVDDIYFKLPTADETTIYRERVYCYELYHQMRTHWPQSCDFQLNGEVDKSGHKRMKLIGAKKLKPDFLVHIPGSMDHNYCVLEVKCNLKPDGIKKDLETLQQFRKEQYERSILLFYGSHDSHTVLQKVEEAAGSLQASLPEIWLHSEVGKSAEKLVC